MKITFLNREEGNSRLLLVFAGWSTNAALYEPFRLPRWDTAVASGFTQEDAWPEVAEEYDTVYLFAWSLGVQAAARAFARRPGRLAAAFAINGTETPVSDDYGIPENVFLGTMQGLDRRNLMKFRRRMAGNREAADHLLALHPEEEDDIERLRAELREVAEAPSCGKDSARLPWKKVFVCEQDAIFPVNNQIAAWRTHTMHPEIVRISEPHLPDFKRIIACTIPDSARIGRRFRQALPTYDRHATAQMRICTRLTELIRSENIPEGGNILEIGTGSGAFTKQYSAVLHPLINTYVDLYECGPFGVAPVENIVVGDAEEWVRRAPAATFDAILSASTIQWFLNPSASFGEFARILKDKGTLVCSTFLPGNLGELDKLRTSPVVYRDADEIRCALESHFSRVHLSEGEIRLTFPDVRALLIHIKHTGVGGSIHGGRSLREIDSVLNPDNASEVSLTYRPLYIVAQK